MCEWRFFRWALFLTTLALLLTASVPAKAEDEGFTIRSIKPAMDSGLGTVKIEFTHPVRETNEVYTYLRLLPPPPHVRVYGQGKNEVTVEAQFRPGARYQVKFAEGFASQAGVPYRETIREFEFPHRPPAIRFSGTGTVVERLSRQLVHFDTLNVDSTLLESHALSPLAALALHLSREGNRSMSWEDQVAAAGLLTSSLRKALPQGHSLRGLVSDISQRRDLYDTKGTDDEETSFSIPLSERPENAKGAALLTRLSDNGTGKKAATEPSVFAVTDLAVTCLQGAGEMLVWVTSLETGLPVKGARVLAVTGEGLLFEAGKTDGDGILRVTAGDREVLFLPRASRGLTSGSPVIREPEEPALRNTAVGVDRIAVLLAVTADDFVLSATPKLPRQRLSSSNIRQTTDVSAKPRPVNLRVFTERGVYRPGDTVFFKAAVRRYESGAIVPPGGEKVRFSITDSRGRPVHQAEAALSDFGTAASEFKVPAAAPLGEYRIETRLLSTGETTAETFRVEEFTPPRHFARVSFSTIRRVDDSYVGRSREATFLKVEVEGAYYAGGPVKNGRVRWQLSYGGSAHSVEGYEDYLFGSEASEVEGIVPLESGESFLDADGRLSLEFPVSREVLTGERGLVVSATVLDFDARAASATRSWQAPSIYQVGILAHPRTIESGTEQHLQAILLDKEGGRIKSGALTVEVLRHSWSYYRKRNLSGHEYWVSERVWKRTYGTEVALKDGTALFDVTFDWGGEYLVRFTHRAADGALYTSSTFFNVDWGSWDEEERSSSGLAGYTRVSLATDRTRYRPGQTARIRVGSNRNAAAYLFALERDRIFEYRVIRPGDKGLKELEVALGEEHLPNVYASLLGTIPRGAFPVYSGRIDEGAPTFLYGVADLPVLRKASSLAVEIAPERKTLEAEPGQEVTLTFVVRGDDGKGARAEMAVAVVDESVLALTGYRTPDLRDLTRFDVPLSVLTSELRLLLLPQTPYKTLRNEALTGGSEGEGPSLETRKRFDPVAYWNPSLLSDESGTAAVRFRLPDQMTSFRVFAIACDAGSGFGNGERQFRVAKPFYLEPGLPRFFNKGDAFLFNVAAFNQTRESGAMEFTLSAEGGLDVKTGRPNYPLAAEGRAEVAVTGVARKAGEASLHFAGIFGERRDAVEIRLPVHTGQVIGQETYYGSIKGNATAAPHLSSGFVEAGKDPEHLADTAVSLTLSASPFLQMTEGLRYLLRYPYGCVEQTSSGVMPLAALYRILQKGAVPGIQAEEVDPYLNKGVERLVSMQTSSGGFGYWPGDREPHPWGTFYAATALAEARDAGFPVPDASLMNLAGYLRSNRLAAPVEDAGGPVALYLLARIGEARASDFEPYRSSLESLDWEARVMVLFAAAETQAMGQEELAAAARKTVWAPQGETNYRHDFHAVHRRDALALLLIDRVSPGDPGGIRLAAKLLEGRSREGHWYRTSDTGWALSALGRHFDAEPQERKAVTVTLRLPSGETRPMEVPPLGAAEVSIPAADFLASPHIEFSSDPGREILYALRMNFPRVDYAQSGHEGGFALTRKHENADGSDAIRVGDLVRVTLEFTPPSHGSEYVALDDPLPAGLVAINTAFKTEEFLPEDNDARNESGEDDFYWYRYWSPDGFYRFVPDRLEIRDDRVAAFSNRIWGGRTEPFRFVYYARAVCEGEFVVPSAKIERMYEPEVNGYTPKTLLRIEKRPK